MKRPGRLLLTALVLAVSCTAAQAGDKRKKAEPEHHDTVIATVTPTSMTISEGKAQKTVAISPSTEIYVRGQKADVAALQAGMAVDLALGMDGKQASRINASDPPVHREIKKVKPIKSLMK